MVWTYRFIPFDSNFTTDEKVFVTDKPELIYLFDTLGTCFLSVSVNASNTSYALNISTNHTLEVFTIKSISIPTLSCKMGSNCSIKALVYPEGISLILINYEDGKYNL